MPYHTTGDDRTKTAACSQPEPCHAPPSVLPMLDCVQVHVTTHVVKCYSMIGGRQHYEAGCSGPITADRFGRIYRRIDSDTAFFHVYDDRIEIVDLDQLQP